MSSFWIAAVLNWAGLSILGITKDRFYKYVRMFKRIFPTSALFFPEIKTRTVFLKLLQLWNTFQLQFTKAWNIIPCLKLSMNISKLTTTHEWNLNPDFRTTSHTYLVDKEQESNVFTKLNHKVKMALPLHTTESRRKQYSKVKTTMINNQFNLSLSSFFIQF